MLKREAVWRREQPALGAWERPSLPTFPTPAPLPQIASEETYPNLRRPYRQSPSGAQHSSHFGMRGFSIIPGVVKSCRGLDRAWIVSLSPPPHTAWAEGPGRPRDESQAASTVFFRLPFSILTCSLVGLSWPDQG